MRTDKTAIAGKLQLQLEYDGTHTLTIDNESLVDVLQHFLEQEIILTVETNITAQILRNTKK